MLHKTIPTLVALALLATPALAQDDSDFARPGVYFGAGGTYAIENFDVPGYNLDNTFGFNVRAGYRAIPNLAVELEYEWYDDFGIQGVEVDGWALTVNGKGYLATGRVQPFVLVGLGVIHGEASAGGLSLDDEAFGVRLGAGIDAYTTENLVISIDASYVLPTGNLDDFQYFALGWGLQWRT